MPDHDDQGSDEGTSVTAERILEALEDPHRLEALYQQAPDAFRRSLEAASRAAPDSIVLKVWQARLERPKSWQGTASRFRLVYAVGVALLSGALVRIPAFWLGEEWYYPRLAPSLVILALAAYFWIEHRSRAQLVAGLGLALVAAAYTGMLPGSASSDPATDFRDSVAMALVHLPLVFWAFLGLVFMGGSWRETDARIRFVRYNGELVVLGSVVALGGFVFSGLTVGLFQLAAGDIEEWYAQNVGVFGAAAVPVIGTYLYDAVFNRRTGIPAVLARVFGPLFLVMAVTYLVVAFVGGQNPFIDRDFLIVFNGLLLVVLGITVFSIVERRDDRGVGLTDYVNLALAVVTLLIDAIALSAIVFRLASYGFTPNRVVVLGANLIIMVHLAWICATYVAVARRKVGFGNMRRVVANYLPVYAAWAAVVAFLLPLAFRFG
ncbi:MAG TPA: hypothetical protein VNL18_06615 [Gemmatimonadales bacterium]|nr:hypothetical protein [Gemmatimonadales bacterium]